MVSPTHDDTYTAAGGHGDLDGVAPGLADILQIQRLVPSLAVRGALYDQRLGVHTHLIIITIQIEARITFKYSYFAHFKGMMF